MLGATVSKAVAARLRRLGLVRPSREAAATALLLIWRRLRGRTSTGDTAPWTELPPELLGLVLWRLPSQADRVRLRAVCRTWRSASLPPQFPWIVVLRDNTFITLPDGALHCLHLCCGETVKARVSTGSRLFVRHLNGRCCLVNPSSRETTPLKISVNLPGHRLRLIRKVVVLSDNILAILSESRLDIIHREPRQGARDMTWLPPSGFGTTIGDIAVFQGKLYVLIRRCNNAGPHKWELHLLDINHEQNCVRSIQCIPAMACAIESSVYTFVYLVASGDRLLMVERYINMSVSSYGVLRHPAIGITMHDAPRPLRTRFEVSEGVDLIGGHGRWSRVDSLMGRALFVGRECSVSLPVQCGAREDCIYFMTERGRGDLIPKEEMKPGDDLLDCVVYNVRDRTMEPLVWETDAARRGGPWNPSWFFPSHV